MKPHVARARFARARFLGLGAALICVACAWQDADAQPPRPGGGVASAGGESSWAVDPASSRIYVFVDKGSLIGHTHAIEGRLAGGEVVLGRQQQAGRLVFDMRSMQADTPAARTALKLEGAIDASARDQTTANMLGPDVLDAATHPTATFLINSAVPVEQEGPGQRLAYRLEGTFTLRGATRPLVVMATFEQRQGDAVLRGQFTLTQTDYGIRPYAKLGGIISIADTLQVVGGLRLLPAATEARP